jgi:RNA polymerase sigma factor (sigma-70 family)
MSAASPGLTDMIINPIIEFIGDLRRAALLQEATEQSDGQLLERFVSGQDDVALETLVRRHAMMVWGVCRRALARQDDAEDAFQATFLVLFRKAASIRSRDLLANWLYRVAYQTARKARQRNAIRDSREKQVETMPEPQTEPHNDAFGPELWAFVYQELSRLPEKYRIAIVLCDLEGQSQRDVAQQLRIAEGTVGSRLARGRAILAQRLTRHGVGVSATSVAAVWSQQAASGAVPEALLSNTIKATTLLAAGETVTAGLLSPETFPLTEGVLHAMAGAKRKAARVVLLLAALALGGGTTAYLIRPNQPSRPEQPPEPPKVSRTDPDAEKYGTAAGARNFAKTYLKGQTKDSGPPSWPPLWPSRVEATFDRSTHQWVVTGAYRWDPLPVTLVPGVDGRLVAVFGPGLKPVRDIMGKGLEASFILQSVSSRLWSSKSGRF